MFDPNGILTHKENTSGNVRKNIRGIWLEKHYIFLSQEEEYHLR